MIRGNIAVRQLAAFLYTTGDLYPDSPGRTVDAEEGISRQRDAQAQRRQHDPSYQTEVSYKLNFPCGEHERTLAGRLDGLVEEGGVVCIEEFKCTGALPDAVTSADRAQAWLYAGLHSADLDNQTTVMEVRVIYIDVETREERIFAERIQSGDAMSFLQWSLTLYVARIERHQQRTRNRDAWSAALDFPMPAYRPNQQAIARRVYRSLHQAENLLLEAPTGSGKSLAVLYPAIRSQRGDDQIFFLTSRNAGALTALATASQLDPQADQLVRVEITAKEKICFVEGMPCRADACPYAANYHARIGPAVNALLDARHADRSRIEAVAEAHTVCPFELTLDAAVWADVVIGDYNYLLDPVVGLQRFRGHDQLYVLIDEAHQLSTRVADMLRVEISRTHVRRAARTDHAAMAGRAKSIDRALLKLKREAGEGVSKVSDLTSLERAIARFMEVSAQEDSLLERFPELADLYFQCWRWQRAQAWLEEASSANVLQVHSRDMEVRRICLDPAPYIAETLQPFCAVVRFSGTVTPLPLYQRMHGALLADSNAETTANSHAERAQSPFHAGQALVLAVDDIPTYYRQRQAGLPRLARLIETLCRTKSGRYLVAVPSYDYLHQVATACDSTLLQFVQAPGMTKTQTDELLAEFSAQDEGILFIVSGGTLSESVDFSSCRLCGVVLVGLGLPPPSLDRDLVAAHFDEAEGHGWGQMVAYTQPALVKNIQAAGRLIRSPDDFGVICLVDPRFTSREVQRFFPGHWAPQRVGAHDVPALVETFWQGVN